MECVKWFDAQNIRYVHVVKDAVIQKYVTVEWTQGLGGSQYHVIYRVNATMRHSIELPDSATT